MTDYTNLISHSNKNSDIIAAVKKIKVKIANNINNYVSTERQYQILEELLSFEMGRFLIANQGLNGYWTHYILNYPLRDNIGKDSCFSTYCDNICNTERFILEKAPGVLASQERFLCFLKIISQTVKNGHALASIPSGVSSDLLLLKYLNIKNISISSIDLDIDSLDLTKHLYTKLNCQFLLNLIQCDAWSIDFNNEFDLLISSGLTIYEPCNRKIFDLYKIFYKALRKNGTLVTSFLTFPAVYKELTEWNMKEINLYNALMQKIIFSDLIGMKWECYRTSKETKQLLQEAGFLNVQIHYDKRKIFPTVTAIK